MRELLLIALVLACPLMMMFMMRGHGHGARLAHERFYWSRESSKLGVGLGA